MPKEDNTIARGGNDAPAGLARTRFGTIEIMRLIATAEIVLFHSQIGPPLLREFAYSGLVVFIVISVFFQFERPASWAAERQRAARLAQVWAFWWAAYTLPMMALKGQPLAQWLSEPSTWLVGGAVHLWYLPFIIVVLPILTALRKVFSRQTLSIAGIPGLLLLAGAEPFWRPWSLTLALPFPQYMHALFPVLSGFAIGAAAPARQWMVVALCAAIGASLIVSDGVGFTYVAGILSFALAYALRRLPVAKPVLALAQCAFGVYLIHPLVFPIAKLFVQADSLACPLLTFVLSMAFVMSVRASGLTALCRVFGLPGRLGESATIGPLSVPPPSQTPSAPRAPKSGSML